MKKQSIKLLVAFSLISFIVGCSGGGAFVMDGAGGSGNGILPTVDPDITDPDPAIIDPYPGVTTRNCNTDSDGDGAIDENCLNGTDCDDNNASISPDATETADDGIDSNCDGVDGSAIDDNANDDSTNNLDETNLDADADGFTTNVDCNDNNKDINPSVREGYFLGNHKDEVDNNCNGQIDEEGCGCNDLFGYRYPPKEQETTDENSENSVSLPIDNGNSKINSRVVIDSFLKKSLDESKHGDKITAAKEATKSVMAILGKQKQSAKARFCSQHLEEFKEMSTFNCIPLEIPAVSENSCTSGETKDAGDGCNTCTCIGEIWSCTLMACGNTDHPIDLGNIDDNLSDKDTDSTSDEVENTSDQNNSPKSDKPRKDDIFDLPDGVSIIKTEQDRVDTHSKTLQQYTAWNGFWMDFAPAQIKTLANYLSNNTGNTDGESTSVTSDAAFEADERSASKNMEYIAPYDWTSRYTSAIHDSSYMRVYPFSQKLTITDKNASSSQKIYLTESSTFKSWYSAANDPQDLANTYYYYTALRGYKVACGKGQRLKDLVIQTKITNDNPNSVEGSADVEDDGSGSQSHHLISNPSKGKIYVQPVVSATVSQIAILGSENSYDKVDGSCEVTVYGDLIGLDKTVLAASYYSWEKASGGNGKSEDKAKTQTINLIQPSPSAEQMFPIISRMGWESDLHEREDGVSLTKHILPNSFDTAVSLSYKNTSSVTVKMWGAFSWKETDENHGMAAPKMTTGYVIHAKDSSVLKTKKSSSGSQYDSGTESDHGADQSESTVDF